MPTITLTLPGNADDCDQATLVGVIARALEADESAARIMRGGATLTTTPVFADAPYVHVLTPRECTCGAQQFPGCFCEGLTLHEFLRSPGHRTAV